MKKKLTLVATSVLLVAALVIGGTLAYFTDTDSKTNTFTVGNVAISLIEQQRGTNKDGQDDLVAFEQNKTLAPIVGSAQGEKDSFGLPTAENYVDKIVTVQNTGSQAAYVRAYFAIPSALDDGYETFNAGANVLHFNFGVAKGADGTFAPTNGSQWIWKHGTDSKWNYFETTIDNIKYNVYFADYYTTLAAGATTEQFVQGVYLDKSFNSDETGYYVIDKSGEKISLALDNGWDWNSVSCPVFAVAVQAAGFDSADAAVTAAFGDKFNPWGGDVTNWQ